MVEKVMTLADLAESSKPLIDDMTGDIVKLFSQANAFLEAMYTPEELAASHARWEAEEAESLGAMADALQAEAPEISRETALRLAKAALRAMPDEDRW